MLFAGWRLRFFVLTGQIAYRLFGRLPVKWSPRFLGRSVCHVVSVQFRSVQLSRCGRVLRVALNSVHMQRTSLRCQQELPEASDFSLRQAE